MGWFDNETDISIVNDLDLNDMILYGVIVIIIGFSIVSHLRNKCKKSQKRILELERRIAASRV